MAREPTTQPCLTQDVRVTSTGGHSAPGWTCTLQTACKSYCVPSSRTLNTISKASSSKSVCPRPVQLSCGPQMALPNLSGRRTPCSSNLRKVGEGETLRRCPQSGITTGHPWQGQGTLHVIKYSKARGPGQHTCVLAALAQHILCSKPSVCWGIRTPNLNESEAGGAPPRAFLGLLSP